MREYNKILELLQGKPTNFDYIDWYNVLGFSEWHRISGYLDNRIKGNIPPQVQRRLSQTKNEQKLRYSFMNTAAKKIGNLLVKKRIRHAFLKGSVLTQQIYEIGERDSNDIDILCNKCDLTEIDEVLKSLGYVQGRYVNGQVQPYSRLEVISRRMSRGETAPYIKATGSVVIPYIEIDINFSLDWLPNGNLVDDFLNFTKVYECGLVGLDIEHHLLFLCMHQYKEETILSMVQRYKDIELYKYLDILLLHRMVNIDRFLEKTKEYNIDKQCGQVLYNIGLLFEELSTYSTNPNGINLIIDPSENNRMYEWTADLKERLFDTKRIENSLVASDEAFMSMIELMELDDLYREMIENEHNRTN